MVKTINGWVQVGNIFVSKTGEKVFNVIRLEESDSNEYQIYYEYYYEMDLNDVNEKTFLPLGIGNFKDFSAKKTDEEKAAYLAFHAYNCAEFFSCDSMEDVSEYLKEDGVIPKEETLKLVF